MTLAQDTRLKHNASHLMDEPLFSVVMPVYNHAAFLRQAVESVRVQTFANWQLVAVDDGSSDDSGKLLDALAQTDSRIVTIHQDNAGPASARNRGVSAARGQWIAFLDSDDAWYPEALQHYAALIEKTPEARFVYGYWNRMDGKKAPPTALKYQQRPQGFVDLFQHVFIGSSCVCIQRQLLLDAGGFDAKLPPVEDYDLFLRLSMKTRLHPTGQATGIRRRHEGNISRDCGQGRLKEAALLERYANDPASAASLTPQIIQGRLGRAFYAAGRKFCRDACYRQAISPLKQALAYRSNYKAAGLLLLSRMMSTLQRRPPG